MASLPRIVTVDPTGSIPQQIRAAFDLMDRLVIQIDVPSANEALEEIKRGSCDVVVAAWEPGDGMQGWELAAKTRQITDEPAIMILGDYDDQELDDEMREQSPFVYLQRPFDIPQLIRVLQAAMEGRDIFEAARPPAVSQSSRPSLGPVPPIDADRADEVMQSIMIDLNPIASMLATREGDIVVGRGTTESIDYEEIANIAVDAVLANLNMREIIGSNSQAMQFFDGDEYDVFVLSVGLHHFLTIIYGGQMGTREQGNVNIVRRRQVQDLIGILGADAWIVQRPVEEPQAQPQQVRRKSQTRPAAPTADEVPELARAELSTSEREALDEVATLEQEVEPEPPAPKMDAISDDDFDPDLLFGEDWDEEEADALFDLDTVSEIAKQDNEGRKGTIDDDMARQLGILED